MNAKNRSKKHILKFSEILIKDVPLVGGKNASLGEMYRKLKSQGVPVPNGFAVTAEAYRYFLKENKLDKQIKAALKGLDIGNVHQLRSVGKQVRQMILSAKLPTDLGEEVYKAYQKLSKDERRVDLDVAVRSSATAEDLPGASFAGQQETY